MLLLSRHPFEGARFEAYTARGLPERFWHGDHFGGKGFAELRLHTPEGPLHLLSTHLLSQYAPDAEDIYWGQRMAQVVQLAARVRALQARVWALLDDPSSSIAARYTSVFIMTVIALSVIAFTLESVPWDCRWVDRYDEATSDGEEVEYLSYNPMRLCSELTEVHAPAESAVWEDLSAA